MNVIDALSLGKIVQIREKLLQAQAAGKRVYRFESGDPSFSLAPHVAEALRRALVEDKTHYVPNNGIPQLKAAVADKLNHKNRIQVRSHDDIFVTNGAMHALFATFSSLLDEGDEVIVPEPMWTEIVENIRLARGVPVRVPLRANDAYQYRPEDIETRIGSKTKAIFVNTPHNPTGAVLSRERLEAIAELARRHQLFIVSDEAYEDIVYAPHEHHSIAALASDLADRIVSVFSMSKSYAMPGLRVGYVHASDPKLKERLPKVLRCTINGVNSLAQWAAAAALSGDQSQIAAMRREYEYRRSLMSDALQDVPGLRPFRPHGTFYIWAELEPRLYEGLGVPNADELSNYLAEQGIGSSPGDAFGDRCRNAIRFAFSCETAMVQQGARALHQALTKR